MNRTDWYKCKCPKKQLNYWYKVTQVVYITFLSVKYKWNNKIMSWPRNSRSVYLVTYSQANMSIVPNREQFADIVVEAFDETGTGTNKVTQWVYSQEPHADGNPHYHMALKLKMQRRWSRARNYLTENHNIHLQIHQTTSLRG